MLDDFKRFGNWTPEVINEVLSAQLKPETCRFLYPLIQVVMSPLGDQILKQLILVIGNEHLYLFEEPKTKNTVL